MSKDQGGPDAFEERLRAARQRQGLEPRPPTPGQDAGDQGPSALAVGMRVSVELVSALAVACAIGWGLDRLLGTRPWFLIAFVPLGGAAGVLNVWRMFAPRRGAGPADTKHSPPPAGR
ncbi:MAG: AtpZ/AtpI family protein [Rhodospirillales bacterium]|jgi:ATP synthase protein I|nr:AtpZ/AtpI family protein [Rhodospirillales bacterium]